jgi:ABC-2 type transport system permease protein
MPEGSSAPRRTSAEVTGPRRTTGRQAVIAVVESATDQLQREKLPNPSYTHLLRPKVLTAVSRASKSDERSHAWRWTVVGAIGLLFWSFVLFVLTRVLTVFRNTPEIGALLAGKVLGLVFISFFMILLLSNIITALSTFFLAKDLELLVSAPVNWLTLYAAKLTESMLHSSWMIALMAVPIFAAYGWVYRGGLMFPFIAIATFIPFLIIPAVVGAAIVIVLVNAFPARRTKDILSIVAVLTGAGVVLLFRLLRPEKFARPEGLQSLVDFITLLRTPTAPYLPSEWVQRTIMSSLDGKTDWLAFYLLWTTAGAALVLGARLHQSLYTAGFTKAQESTQRWVRGRIVRRAGHFLLQPFGILRRELVMKELRVFFRDTTQWSQLILLAVLVIVYVFNVKFLPLSGAGITTFLVNTIPFLNLGLAGFVLASVAARFIFPAVSVEGRTLWLLKSSPLPMRALLWSKFWIGTLPLLILAVGIIGVTDAMLQVTEFIFAVSIFTIVFLTFAIAGLALGLGAVFPQYDTENAAQIPTSFGGLVFMMLSAGVVGAVVLLEARPVYGYLTAEAFGGIPDPMDMYVGFGLAALLCLACTFVPITVALRRLERLEL